MKSALETLVAAAVRAPSGDNTQPWRFVVDSEARRITIHLDETKDVSPMNSGQRMARVAVGAAIENIVRTAEYNGLSVELQICPGGGSAIIDIENPGRRTIEIDPAILTRVTNRRVYDGRPIPPETLFELERATPELERIRTSWIVDRHRVGELALLIAQADEIMFTDPAVRRAFLANLRFDAPWDSPVERGLSLASLELSGSRCVGLRMIFRLPDRLFKLSRGRSMFARHARRLAQSASGLALVLAPDISPVTDILLGRGMQRAWLALTALGLAAQPMMSLAILDTWRAYPRRDLADREIQNGTESLLAQFHAIEPKIGNARLGALLRFGYGPAPSGRTGRLPLTHLVAETAMARRPADPTHGHCLLGSGALRIGTDEDAPAI